MEKFVGILATGVLLAGLAAVAIAEDGEGPNFTFGAATSFVYDFNDPDRPLDPDADRALNSATYSTFEQAESFNIDMIQIGVTGQRGPVTYGATLDFGDLAAAAGDGDDVSLETAWLGYEQDVFGFTAGRFGTPIGYEVLSPWGNRHISRSWGWTAQPINHDGIQAHAGLGPVDLMVGAVNGFTVADASANDLNDEKGAIWSVGSGISDALNLYFSGIYTEDVSVDDSVMPAVSTNTDILMLNAIVSGDLATGGDSPVLSYAVEGNWRKDNPEGDASTDFWNVGLYFGTSIGKASVGLRADYTDDEGILAGVDTEIWSVTVTGAYTLVDGVDFRVEYRHDDADTDLFADGPIDVVNDDAIDTVQAQLIWYPEL
jgi:hypothetical protein